MKFEVRNTIAGLAGKNPQITTIFLEVRDSEKFAEQELISEGKKLNEWADANGYTVIVPTCTSSEGAPKPVFSADTAKSEEGLFSELYRTLPDVIRSHNPTHSVAAYGIKAGEICSKHRSAYGRNSRWGEISFGKNSPWDWMSKNPVLWISFGADLSNSPMLDFIKVLMAEKRSPLTKECFYPEFSTPAFEDALKKRDILNFTDGNIQGVYSCELGKVINFSFEIFENDFSVLEPDELTRKWYKATQDILEKGFIKAAKGKVEVTPPLNVRRWEGKNFEGIASPIYARFLALRKNEKTVIFINCELLGISGILVERIRDEINQKTGVDKDAIMIAVTHAHSTPDTLGAGFENFDYLDQFVQKVSEMVIEGIKEFIEVRIGWTKRTIKGIAHSRRILLKDGTVFTTRFGVPSTWRVDPAIIADKGNNDDELTVIRIEKTNGDLFSVITSFACHPTVAIASVNIGGDYLGEAMQVLERVYADMDITALTFNGAAGDVDPTKEIPYWGPRTDENARKLGKMFAAEVLFALERTKLTDDCDISWAAKKLTFPIRPSWIKMVREQQSTFQTELAPDFKMSAVFLDNLAREELNTEIQVIKINDLNWVAMPGEIFSDSSIALKKRLSEYPIAICELANDNIGYVPTPIAFDQGGYEVNGVWGKLNRDAEAVFMNAAEALILGLNFEKGNL
ncbi:MAG: AAC(3) family N-acetyltransferase [Flexilinea sp.]